MNNTKRECVVVPLFRTFEELNRDEEEIAAKARAEWLGADEACKLALSAIDETEIPALQKGVEIADTVLAKGAASRSEILDAVRAKVALLEKRLSIQTAEQQALKALITAREAALQRREDAICGHTALAKRSLRFASAHARKNYGPGATSLPPAS